MLVAAWSWIVKPINESDNCFVLFPEWRNLKTVRFDSIFFNKKIDLTSNDFSKANKTKLLINNKKLNKLLFIFPKNSIFTSYKKLNWIGLSLNENLFHCVWWWLCQKLSSKWKPLTRFRETEKQLFVHSDHLTLFIVDDWCVNKKRF